MLSPSRFISLSRSLRCPRSLSTGPSTEIEMMPAVLVSEFGPSSVLRVQDVARPGLPGAGQCVVRMHACGVNPVDTYIRSGAYGKLPDLPYVPGKDGAGVVEQLGTDSPPGLKVGDRVYVYNCLSGSYARFSLCNASHVFPLPSSISFVQGACLGTPAFTAYRALFEKGRAQPGDSLFVHGASGGVGLMAIQMATAAGLKVMGTASTPQGLQAIMDAGAIAAFDHSSEGYMDEVKTREPNGFDICIDMLANRNLGVDLPLMAMKGRVCVVGSRGSVEINPRDLMSKELEVYGVALLQSDTAAIKRASSFVSACLIQGSLTPTVSLEFPLDEAAQAHEEVIQRSNVKMGNIVLTF